MFLFFSFFFNEITILFIHTFDFNLGSIHFFSLRRATPLRCCPNESGASSVAFGTVGQVAVLYPVDPIDAIPAATVAIVVYDLRSPRASSSCPPRCGSARPDSLATSAV